MSDQPVRSEASPQDPKIVAFVRGVAWAAICESHGDYMTDDRITETVNRNMARLSELTDDELTYKLLMELDADELPRA